MLLAGMSASPRFPVDVFRAVWSWTASQNIFDGSFRRGTFARRCWSAPLLLLAVTLVFGQTLRCGFVNYDDNAYVSDNPQVAKGLTVQGIGWAFTTCRGSMWGPLTWLSHMLDCQLYGLHAWGHHLTNILLHAASTILLFLVLWRMTGDLWPSAFVAALFAIHPLHVESVAWLAERKDLLSGLFFVLTLGPTWATCATRFRCCAIWRWCYCLPWADGQADTGDAAVRAAAVGLLAVGANETEAAQCRATGRDHRPRSDVVWWSEDSALGPDDRCLRGCAVYAE